MKKALWNFNIKGLRNPMISDKGFLLDRKLFFSLAHEKKGFYESKLFALDIDTGSETDLMTVPHVMRNTVLYGNECLYINAFNGVLYCIDCKDLSVKWECKFGKGNPDWHLGLTEKSVLTFDKGELFLIDQSTGQILSSYKHQISHANCSMLIKNNCLFHGLSEGYFYCLDLIKNQIKWTFGEGIYFRSAAFLSDTTVVACAVNGLIYFIDILSGEAWASFDTGDAIYREPVIEGNKILIGNDAGSFLCLEVEEAKGKTNDAVHLLWEYQSNEKVSSRAVIQGDSLLFSSEDHFVYKLDMSTGHEISRRKIKSFARDILIDCEKIFLLCDKGQVDCYSESEFI